jgi:hypothetical protein
MPFDTVCSVHLPYCLKKQDDGAYAEYPIGIRLKGMNAKAVAKISWNGDADTSNIYLYNDGCVPTRSAANMNAYLKRLAHLAKFRSRE